MAAERYRRVRNPETRRHTRAHRLVAAEVLGRELVTTEVVHHLNGDRTDNRPENLQVLPSQAHHMAAEHIGREARRGQEPLFELLPHE